MESTVSRRSFIAAGAFVAGTVATALTGCAPKTASGADNAATSVTDAASVNWDEEYDFVVCGSGTAVVGAIAATEQGGTAIVLEKGSLVGGTTGMSGLQCWIPGNRFMEKAGIEELPEDDVLAYMMAADTGHGASEELKLDYVRNARKFIDYAVDSWQWPMAVAGITCDYYNLPGAMDQCARSLCFVDEAGVDMDAASFNAVLTPMLDQRGIEIRTKSEVVELIRDESGRVIGVKALKNDDPIFYKANKGVLLGCGGFEHNAAMRNQYLYGPLQGLISPTTNTGDGHRMGQRIGAALGNMSSIWGNPFYITDEEHPEQCVIGDYGITAGSPGAIMVNAKGRRFVNEASGYDPFTNAFYNWDSTTYSFGNMPAWLIVDQKHIDEQGWPGWTEEQPEWLLSFETLDELAEACGIDATGLKDEVARFNGFCEIGVDEDFGRGSFAHDTLQVAYMGLEFPDLKNICLGPIGDGPYYTVKMGPGAFGTNGGLLVNTDAQVMDLDGNPIEGLYCCGNNSSSIMGTAYCGPGATVGQGFYQAFRAANHALHLNLI